MEKKLSTKDRFAELGCIGVTLMREMDEKHLLRSIAEAACELTGAQFAAFTLRQVSDVSRPLGPSEGNVFHLGAVVGVTPEEEAWFEQTSLGGRGVLTPIFHQGLSVLVPDLKHYDAEHYEQYQHFSREIGLDPVQMISEDHSPVPVGIPHKHPQVRSFLGAPLLSRNYEVLGALLLGHSKPKRFDTEDEAILVGLAAQAAVALENTRLINASATANDRERLVIGEYIRQQALRIIIDELPGGVLLLQGDDAKMLLANHASTTGWGSTWYYKQPYADYLRQNGIRVFNKRGIEIPYDELRVLLVLRQGEEVRNYQEIIRLADGSEFPILINAFRLNVGGWMGKMITAMEGIADEDPIVVVTHQDISVLKEAERVKEEFIGIAAHELRSPLAVMHGFVQTLSEQTRSGHGTPLEDWQEEALEGIDEAAMRMKLLLDDLLDVSRVQMNRLSMTIEPCDLIALVRRSINRMQVTTQRHQISLHTDLDYLVVLADSHRTEQVVDNLLANAIKYSPDGGAIDVHVALTTSAQKETVALLSVQDHGIGIPQNQRTRLFHRFQRADNARSINGTGLGLYICRAIAEQQHGEIWFDSREGHGSTFFMTIPLYHEEANNL